MSTKNVEIEVKIPVDNLALIEQRLKSHGAVLSAERVYERNVRYDDSKETLKTEDKVLRLRQDTRARITYKEGESNTSGIIARTELEVTVSDFDTADLLLQKLGYHAAWIYEKYRTTYDFLNCEVVLDEMPYGKFIEVEGEVNEIEKVLSALELADAPRLTLSYSALFFRIKDQLRLDFQDLTFQNFVGITVPDNLLR